MMEIEKADQIWECHECGIAYDNCTWIHLKNLCQHMVSLCPGCLEKLKKLLSS